MNKLGKEMRRVESNSKKPQNQTDVKEMLAEQMTLIAQRSKEIISNDKKTDDVRQELYFLSSVMLEIGRYLNEKYFDKVDS